MRGRFAIQLHDGGARMALKNRHVTSEKHLPKRVVGFLLMVFYRSAIATEGVDFLAYRVGLRH